MADALWAIHEALRLLASHVKRLSEGEGEVRAEIDQAIENVEEAIKTLEGN